jgi:hypothetical protein
MTKLPDSMPSLDEILLDTDAVPWREKSLKGIHEKCCGETTKPEPRSP